MAKWGSLVSVGLAGFQPASPEFLVVPIEKPAQLSEIPEKSFKSPLLR
jgi:hypothetical protein